MSGYNLRNLYLIYSILEENGYEGRIGGDAQSTFIHVSKKHETNKLFCVELHLERKEVFVRTPRGMFKKDKSDNNIIRNSRHQQRGLSNEDKSNIFVSFGDYYAFVKIAKELHGDINIETYNYNDYSENCYRINCLSFHKEVLWSGDLERDAEPFNEGVGKAIIEGIRTILWFVESMYIKFGYKNEKKFKVRYDIQRKITKQKDVNVNTEVKAKNVQEAIKLGFHASLRNEFYAGINVNMNTVYTIVGVDDEDGNEIDISEYDKDILQLKRKNRIKADIR